MLVSDEPGLGCVELLWVNEDETPRLGKGLQHERCQPGYSVYRKRYLTTKNLSTGADEKECGRLGNVDG